MTKPNENKKGQHNFAGTILNWKYCVKCGLITLKNEPTRRAMKRKCDDE